MNPAAARGNTTSGIYPGTLKDICVGDTIFAGETDLNLTPLTPGANGIVQALQKFSNDKPGSGHLQATLTVTDSHHFDVGSVDYYGTYFPVVSNQILEAYTIQIQPSIPMYPQNVVVTSSSDWVIANGADSALLTVAVTDGGNNPVSGADITMSAGAPWSLRDYALKTDGAGKAQTVFLPTTRSGAAVISASAFVGGVTPSPVTTTLLQKIDAATPYVMKTTYPGTATVGSQVRISVQVMDRFGNPVTSRRVQTDIGFSTPAGGTAAFLDGNGTRVKAISVPLNDTGYAEVTFSVGTTRGNNFIAIVPPSPVSLSLITIVGIGDSRPFSIIQSVNPAGNPPRIPADGSSKATIDYYLFDQWGNPSGDQAIQIITTAGEDRIFYTNPDGRATIVYGPKLSAGFYGITATAVMNNSVTAAQTLEFESMDPKDMLLTATPQTMASLDVNPDMTASVIAKVIDERGNPVKGQTVIFEIRNIYNASYIQTQGPAIGRGGATTMDIGVPIPVATDENGQAILEYRPGAFPTYGSPGWSDKAQGTTTVNASWDGPTGIARRSINLSYKNYPFLSVYTEVRPQTVQVGGEVDVSVRLKGDGWALQIKPIDVVLCTDRSGSMLINESVNPTPIGKLSSESENDRMVDAMRAANTFVSLTSDQDWIGLVTFGSPTGGWAVLNNSGGPTDMYLSSDAWQAGRDYNCRLGKTCHNVSSRYIDDDRAYIDANYPGHGTGGKDYRVNGVNTGAFVESELTSDKGQVMRAVNSTVPAGGTPMRPALYESVKAANRSQRTGTVRAIILLSDGGWNKGGDPRGIDRTSFGGPESYIELERDPLLGDGRGSVITWAKHNNIKIFTIALLGDNPADRPNEAELRAYADETGGKFHLAKSSGELQGIYEEIAGELREEASVNTLVRLDFSEMEVNSTFHVPGKEAFEYVHYEDRSTLIVPPWPALPGPAVDSSEDWDEGVFNFSAGTIKLDQEWMVNFTLRARIEGNIEVLSSGSSKVTFEGTEGEVGVPDTFVTAIPRGTEKGPDEIVFEITSLDRINPASDTQIAQLVWEFIYTGHEPTLDWEISLAPPGSLSYAPVESFTLLRGVSPVYYPLAIGDLKPGTYSIRIRGHAGDAPRDPVGTLPLTIPEPSVTNQILIR